MKYSVFNVNRLLECHLNRAEHLNLTATVLLGKENVHLLIPAQSYYKTENKRGCVCCVLFHCLWFLSSSSSATYTDLLVDFCFVLQVVPLASVIVKEAMTDEDVLNCQKTIYNLVDMERKNDPLPISTVGTRGKGPKRLHAYLFLLMLDFSQKYYVYIVFIPNF